MRPAEYDRQTLGWIAVDGVPWMILCETQWVVDGVRYTTALVHTDNGRWGTWTQREKSITDELTESDEAKAREIYTEAVHQAVLDRCKFAQKIHKPTRVGMGEA